MAEAVSILIPAYNERFFPEALESALAQEYGNFEVVVCDDSPGTAIEQCVRDARSPRVRYRRNTTRLGFGGNFTRCLAEARADLAKFLNDDDRLRPGCLGSLAGALETNPGASLATSRRRVIDGEGRELAGVASAAAISHVSAFMPGRELGDFVLANALNLIGEPTTVMFRRSRVAVEEGALFRWGGKDYHCLADLALWLRLLAKGLAFYHAGMLSEFRLHEGQEQRGEAIRLDAMDEWLAVMRQARTAGFLSTPALWRQAMASLRSRVMFGGPLEGYEPATRSRLERVLREVDAELEPVAGRA
jgi:glycosyltransferase involved in cell wall biosynthesis